VVSPDERQRNDVCHGRHGRRARNLIPDFEREIQPTRRTLPTLYVPLSSRFARSLDVEGLV
jgi:hypothetical protein